jgi:hypothetical protein
MAGGLGSADRQAVDWIVRHASHASSFGRASKDEVPLRCAILRRKARRALARRALKDSDRATLGPVWSRGVPKRDQSVALPQVGVAE